MQIPSGLHANYWRQRDWERLLSLPNDTEDNSTILLMLCGAALQSRNPQQASRFISRLVGVIGQTTAYRLLLCFQKIQIARAIYVVGRPKKALGLFQFAYKTLGELALPLIYDFLFELAEAQLAAGDARAAVQSFHDIAILLQENTPEEVYHRMSDGYAANSKGFGGTKDENKVWGDCHKHDLLSYFHQQLRPEFYFEIGVDEGRSLARAEGKALGVDARPKLNLAVELPQSAEIVSLSSDRFFRQVADNYLASPPELAFIDGMHLFEFALRDFINLEKYAAPYTLVCIDDVFPCHPVQAERRRVSGSWTGDVWKLIPIFERYRPDLNFICLPCSTTGLMLISGLDASNTQLTDHYDEILQLYQKDLRVPKAILNREGSLPSDHPVISLFLNILLQAKCKKLTLNELKQQLSILAALVELITTTR